MLISISHSGSSRIEKCDSKYTPHSAHHALISCPFDSPQYLPAVTALSYPRNHVSDFLSDALISLFGFKRYDLVLRLFQL